MPGTCTPSGSQTTIAIKQGSGSIDWSSGATQLRHNAENLSVQYPGGWIAPPSLTGNSWVEYTDLRRGASMVAGSIHLSLRPSELRVLFPLIFGGSETVSGGGYTYAITEDVPYFGILVDRVTDVFEYLDCKVNRAIISSQSSALQGESPTPVSLTLEILGTSGSIGNTWDAGISLAAMAASYKPYIHEESTLTLNSVDYRKSNLILAVNNNLAPNFWDGLTPSSICPNGKKSYQLRAAHPYADPEDDLYAIGETGVGGSLEFDQTGNTISTLFTFKRLQQLPEDPNARGPGAIRLFTDWRITGDDDEAPMTIFNDVTA